MSSSTSDYSIEESVIKYYCLSHYPLVHSWDQCNSPRFYRCPAAHHHLCKAQLASLYVCVQVAKLE